MPTSVLRPAQALVHGESMSHADVRVYTWPRTLQPACWSSGNVARTCLLALARQHDGKSTSLPRPLRFQIPFRHFAHESATLALHLAAMRKTLYSTQNQALLRLLRRYRQQRRLRQADLGRLLGRDQAMVSKVESGERRLDVIELRAWLSAMDVDFLMFMREFNDVLSNLGTG